MATKLQQAITLLNTMIPLELDYVRTYAAQKLHNATDTPQCLFLRLPLELRNVIYTLAASSHLLHHRGTRFPALLAVSKQIRAEFRDVYYCGKTLRIRVIDDEGRWVEVGGRGIVKAALDGGRYGCGVGLEDVEEEVRGFVELGEGENVAYGVLEVRGVDGGGVVGVVAIPRGLVGGLAAMGKTEA